MANALPYLFSTNGLIWAECTHAEGLELQSHNPGSLLSPDFSPKAKAPSKPKPVRKLKSRVFVSDLPLSNTPPAPVLGSSDQTSECGSSAAGTMQTMPPSVDVPASGQPGLTPSQVRNLERAERFGILSEDGCRHLRAWRLAISRAELAKKPETFIGKLQRWLRQSEVG